LRPRNSPRPASPRPWLAALAHVSAPSAHHDLADRTAAPNARLTRARVDEEAVLEGAAGAVDVAEIVDRGAFGLDPFAQRLLDRVVQARPVSHFQASRRSQRVDPGAKQGFVGVDV